MLQKLQPTLEEVQQLFEEWRRNKRRRDRIPAALWEATASLSGQHSANNFRPPDIAMQRPRKISIYLKQFLISKLFRMQHSMFHISSLLVNSSHA